MENLQISLLFLLEFIAVCWLTLLARSVPMARMLCAHQPLSHHCPSPSLPTPEAGQKQCINNEGHIFYISIAKQDVSSAVRNQREHPKTLSVLLVPSPTDSRETTQALVSSPCWGSSSRHDRAEGCCHHNSSLSPVRCRGFAACSAATRWSEPASHWPVGGDRMWIPPPQHNKSLHFSSREFMKFLNFPLIWLQWHKAVASLQINKACESLLPPTYYFSWKTGVNLEEKYLPQICLEAAIPPP